MDTKKFDITKLKLVKELRGEICHPVGVGHPPKKNICTSRSFGIEVANIDSLKESISSFAANCARKLRDQNTVCKKVSVFIKTNSFKPNIKQYQGYQVLELPTSTSDTIEISNLALRGLKNIYRSGHVYKKAGVIVHDIGKIDQIQLNMFDRVDRDRRGNLMTSYDAINSVEWEEIRVETCCTKVFDRKWKMRQERLSPCYTTRMTELLEVKL